MVLTVVACELAVDLGPYQQPCPANQKACPNADTGKMTCVNATTATATAGLTDYGCDPHTCRSCFDVPNNNVQEFHCTTSGTCEVTTCLPGWNFCASTRLCESNSNTDSANCKVCGNDCSKPPNVPNAGSHYLQSGCVSGTCKVTQCEAGFADCDGSPTNGCESMLAAGTCCPPQGACPGTGCQPCAAGKTCDMTTLPARPMCK
jgi:hypothetical protein